LPADVELPEAQLAQFIFMSGFSTATEVSQVSGRGVGLDVVKNEITSLGGRVEIASHAGRGTTFTITLPLTLAVTQAVMVRAGQTIHAIPSVMIEQVQEFKAQPYAECSPGARSHGRTTVIRCARSCRCWVKPTRRRRRGRSRCCC
jgi:chemosensory pili system protein ChpA (sensor histidine kinase/response regulator)